MDNILFVVSTLRRTGPTKQLYYILKYLDRKRFNPIILTLSPEPNDSLKYKFIDELNVSVNTLNLSRYAGYFYARNAVKDIIKKYNIDIIHTQGIRADSIGSSLSNDIKWIMTIRNFPYEDYPSKFGYLRGIYMASRHISKMRNCNYVVACSNSIHHKISNYGVKSIVIQNGIDFISESTGCPILLQTIQKPIYISVGSLIPRKNMRHLIESFKSIPKSNRGSLVILGDGPEFDSLKSISDDTVFFTGLVENVTDYLLHAHYYVSTSISEGLPNTVLEALAAGLPTILSDIPSHYEISNVSKGSCEIFNLNGGILHLGGKLSQVQNLFNDKASEDAKRLALDVFSAKNMSEKYQKYYNHKQE
jgi:glycosyltransferase involved in cell wall biosynthesis